jgi:hypothetical protein
MEVKKDILARVPVLPGHCIVCGMYWEDSLYPAGGRPEWRAMAREQQHKERD